MKLLYKQIPPKLGGSAISGCGTIHHTEISKTMDFLSNDLALGYNLNNYLLGSTGKREYSGDIDLVLANKTSPTEFMTKLIEMFGRENVARNGAMVHLRYPIADYNISYDEAKPRTGYVQVDFNFGEPEWEKFYHFSDSNSAYKGAHRNLAISSIIYYVDRSESEEVDTYNRPISAVRWKWGQNGLIKVERKSIKKGTRWLSKQEDIVLAGPFLEPEKVAKLIFPDDGTVADLASLETVMAAVKRNYSPIGQASIWRRMAMYFTDWNLGKYFIYPPEIDSYLEYKV